jgi:hypothetical protein
MQVSFMFAASLLFLTALAALFIDPPATDA